MISGEESSPRPQVAKKTRSEKRRRDLNPIKVRVGAEELARIAENAAACALTVPEFLRRLGQGFVPKGRIDQMHIRDLCAIAGELGKASGLLKLWMAEQRAGTLPQSRTTIEEVDFIFRDIQEVTAAIRKKVAEL